MLMQEPRSYQNFVFRVIPKNIQELGLNADPIASTHQRIVWNELNPLLRTSDIDALGF